MVWQYQIIYCGQCCDVWMFVDYMVDDVYVVVELIGCVVDQVIGVVEFEQYGVNQCWFVVQCFFGDGWCDVVMCYQFVISCLVFVIVFVGFWIDDVEIDFGFDLQIGFCEMMFDDIWMIYQDWMGEFFFDYDLNGV